MPIYVTRQKSVRVSGNISQIRSELNLNIPTTLHQVVEHDRRPGAAHVSGSGTLRSLQPMGLQQRVGSNLSLGPRPLCVARPRIVIVRSS